MDDFYRNAIFRSSLIVTIPLETQLHSSIAQFYNGDLFNPTDWSPLVIVDLTPADVRDILLLSCWGGGGGEEG